MPVILAIQEPEIRRILIKNLSQANTSEEAISKKSIPKNSGRVALVLTSMRP
jgi:hypothetical protein